MTISFNFKVRCYDPQNALFLARASQAVYFPDTDIKKFAHENAGSSEPRIFKKEGTRGFIALVEKAAFVAFEGTNEIKDWLTNGDVRFVKGTWGWVHKGFRDGLNKVWPDMKRFLNDHADAFESIWFTGHSLGGALAMLAAADFLVEKGKVDGVYTFGQPRVGDGIFRRYFDHKLYGCTFRFANDRDVVPRVLPRELGYCDAGRSFYFNLRGKLYQDAQEWQKYLNRFASTAEEALLRYQELISEEFTDHNIAGYIKNLEKNQ